VRITAPESYQRTEIVVIGSGPGGSITAATLASAGKEVLLIEEGPDLTQDSCVPFSFTEMKQKYRAGGITAAFGKPSVAYAEGSCVGGGSEVNSGLYHRTPVGVMEQWARDYHVEFFSPDSMTRYFEACEAVMQPVTYPEVLPKSSTLLRDGAHERGMASQDVPRLVEFTDELDEQGVNVSRRRSMTETYIPMFFRNGGTLLANTRVSRVARQRSCWEVHAIHAGKQPVMIRADKIFVCAGAVHTPALLQRSGIRKNVGKTLSLQPMVKLTAEFDEDVNFSGMGIAGEQVSEFSPEFSFGCAISSPAHLAINLVDEPGGPTAAAEKQRKLISYYLMSRGTLNGSVHAIPGFVDPIVRYKVSEAEFNNLGKGVKALTRVLLAAGAKHVYTGLSNYPRIDSLPETDAMPNTLAPGAANIMTVHLMSSCPMGEDKRKAAVNSWGRVHGHAGLYVSDVSALCTSPGVNPQGTIMALALRNSEHFLKVES
jgi:choline dehydrogenase-like flavoprotein